jgi:hypothetical protein
VIIEKGHGVQVGKGMSGWGNVHIRDVGRLFCSLAEATIARDDEEALWGENGIYLAGVGELVSPAHLFESDTRLLTFKDVLRHFCQSCARGERSGDHPRRQHRRARPDPVR